MASHLWAFCFVSFLSFTISWSNEIQVSLTITPHINENIEVHNENDLIFYICKVNGAIPDGVSLFWYQKLRSESRQILKARNDNNPITKDELIYTDIFNKQSDMSEIYCIAKIFNGKFQDIGRSQSIYLVLNKTDLKTVKNEPQFYTDLKEKIINEKSENDYKNSILTPLIIIFVVALLIIIMLLLVMVILYRQNQRPSYQEHINSIYSYARSVRYLWSSRPQVSPYGVSNFYINEKQTTVSDGDGVYEEIQIVS